MQIIGTGYETFLLLNGVETSRNIALDDRITLQPADTSHVVFEVALSTISTPQEIAVIAAFLPLVRAELKVTDSNPNNLAIRAWNSVWDAVLLSAIFNTEVGCNIQSDTTSSKICSESKLRATNFYMHGLVRHSPYALSKKDELWIEKYFIGARELMVQDRFNTAVHCLSSFRWHSVPRIKLAVLWAGIEGLFGADAEIRFRIGLYIARFLYPDNSDTRKATFDRVKKLYNLRSLAVHGGKLKGDVESQVLESAKILQNLVVRCIEIGSLPKEDTLVP